MRRINDHCTQYTVHTQCIHIECFMQRGIEQNPCLFAGCRRPRSRRHHGRTLYLILYVSLSLEEEEAAAAAAQ